jgi:hypothetical protein
MHKGSRRPQTWIIRHLVVNERDRGPGKQRIGAAEEFFFATLAAFLGVFGG